MMSKENRRIRESAYDGIFGRASYWILLALVFLLPLTIFPFEDDLFSLPKVTLLRLLFLVAAALWGVQIFGQKKIVFKRSLLDIPLLLFVVILFASSLLSFSPLTSFLADSYLRHENFFTWLMYAGLFALVTQGLRSREQAGQVIRLMVAASGLVTLYALIQPLGLDLLDLDVQGFFKLQAKSTFGNPIYLGGYLSLVLPLALALILTEERKGRKVLWVLIFFLGVLSLVFTFSRGAWLGAATGALVFLVLLARDIAGDARRRRELRTAVAIVVILIVVAVAISELVPTTSGLMESRLRALITGQRGGSGRLYIWESAVDLISQKPLLGWGLNTFKDVLPYDRREFGGARSIDRPHNQILSVAFSGGALLLLTYLWFIVCYFLGTWKALKQPGEERDSILAIGLFSAAASYLVQEQFFFSLVEVTPLFWIILGTSLALAHGSESRKWQQDLSKISNIGLTSGTVLIIGTALVLSAISTSIMVANYFHSRGLLSENAGRFKEAASFQRTAIQLNPWENRYKFSYGQALEDYSMVSQNSDLLKPAVPVYLAGLRQNPRDYDLHFALGKSYYTISFLDKSRDYGKARLYLLKAAELRPLAAEPYLWLGLAYMQESEFALGLKYLEKSRETGTTEYGDVPVLFALAQANFKLGRIEKARGLLNEVLKLRPDYSEAKELLSQLDAK